MILNEFNKLKPVLCLIILFLLSGQAGAQDKYDSLYLSLKNFKLSKSANADVISYSLETDFVKNFYPPYPHSFNASVEIILRDTDNDSLVSFNINPFSIKIQSVEGDALLYKTEGERLTVKLKTPDKEGRYKIRIKYEHLNVEDGSFFVSPDILFTNNAPEGTRNWMPSHDVPHDKALFEVKAMVPRKITFASNGLLTDSAASDSTVIYHWKTTVPLATYLITIAGSSEFLPDYFTVKEKGSGKEIPVRMYRKISDDPASYFFVKGMLEELNSYFSHKFGSYPFEKIGFVTLNEKFIYGGMENQTLISLCDNCWNEILVAHEFAHTWFGNKLTCLSWADIWLNESFARYSEALWSEATNGSSGYLNHVLYTAQSYFDGKNSMPLYNGHWAFNTPGIDSLYDGSVIYDKGAAVLHMLRGLAGDSIFFNRIGEYLTRFGSDYGNAFTADLIGVFNETGITYLDQFFKQWLLYPAHPKYKISYNTFTAGDSVKLAFELRQIQDTPPFIMDAEILVKYSDGTEKLLTFLNDKKEEKKEFLLKAKPAKVIFDPYFRILLKEVNGKTL